MSTSHVLTSKVILILVSIRVYASTVCENSTLTQSEVTETLNMINAARTRVYHGKQMNGDSGTYLPVAASVTLMKWDCNLEEQSFIDSSGSCQGGPMRIPDNQTNEQFPNLTLLNVIKSYLTPINYTAFTNIAGNVIYSGETDLRVFALLISANDTKIGCAQYLCFKDTGIVEKRIICNTDGDLKVGDTVYVANTDKNACEIKPYMNDTIRTRFLLKHNTLRITLALGTATNGRTGKKTRPAQNMVTLVYDCELEKFAYERAMLCENFTVESPDTLKENSWNYTHRSRTFEKAAQLATQQWWSELIYSEGLNQTLNIFYTHLGMNHFAKIASDTTTKVGCGIYNCTSIVNIVCRYETALTDMRKLYVTGENCKSCKETCVNGLCPAVVSGAKL